MTKDIDDADRLVVGCLAAPVAVALMWGIGALVMWAVGVPDDASRGEVLALSFAFGMFGVLLVAALAIGAMLVGALLLDSAAIYRALEPVLRRTRRVTRRG